VGWWSCDVTRFVNSLGVAPLTVMDQDLLAIGWISVVKNPSIFHRILREFTQNHLLRVSHCRVKAFVYATVTQWAVGFTERR